jgi:hypothetical protein
MLMDGDAAACAGRIGARPLGGCGGSRCQLSRKIEPQWPDDVPVLFENVDLAIARTRAPYGEVGEVREIETLYLDMIAAAKSSSISRTSI